VSEAAILDSARYLRGVRPLDPEELCQYVAGGTHPAVVSRVLREHAHELGVRERADGLFVPVEAGSLRPVGEVVEALPERYDRRLEELLVEEYGPDFHRGGAGERLRERVRRLKRAYDGGDPPEYDRETALAYAVYHLPDFYAAGRYVLDELAADGLLDRRLRVLDVGAGVGGPALALADLVSADDGVCAYHAVEPSPAADVFEALFEAAGRNVRPTVHRTTAEAFDPGEGWDLVLFGNVLNELAAPADTLERYLGALAPEGSLVAVAPADRRTSVGLRAAERAVEDRTGATVYAPEVRLWPDRRPTDDGWGFDERPELAVSAPQRVLDRAAGSTGEFRKTAVRYSYAVVRRDECRRFGHLSDRDRTPLAATREHVGGRLNVGAIKLSRSLAEEGNPLYRVGDGSQSEDHFAVLTDETGLNRDLRRADYGDLLLVERALVLYNDDQEAVNLVVDEETVVDRVPA
jgi:SAM-dependent methyltransferase